MRKLYLLAVSLFLCTVIYAAELPKQDGLINDFANIISEEHRNKLNVIMRKLEQETSVEIVIATVNSISPYGEKEYAKLLFNEWKIGKKGKDNGVLILVALKERRWRIAIGYGLEKILTNVLCAEIGDKYMAPYFKKSNYGEGFYYGISAIAKLIENAAYSNASDIDVKINRYNNGFRVIYRSDLTSWVGKNVQDLEQAFDLKGSSSLDLYGNGWMSYEEIVPPGLIGSISPNRLIFYLKNNKIYNVVKE